MDEPIRILHVSGTLNQGGAENMNMNLYRAIDRKKVLFDFVEHTDQEAFFEREIISLGGRVYRVPKYRVINHFRYKNWWKKFFRDHPEYKVVHSHVRSTASIIFSVAKKAGLKTIAHSHSIQNGSGIKGRIKYLLQKNITKNADYLFACSKAAGEWLFPGKKFIVFHNAIDVNKYIFSLQTRAEVRKEFHIPDNTFIVGTVGRFITEKNPHGLIDIFKEIRKVRTTAKLLWVGEGEMRQEIERRIRDEGMADSVILTGVRSDVPRILQAMDVFVFPSLWEGLGIAAIEAQAAGLPCFCSDAVPEEVAVTDLCMFLPLNNPQSWAREMLNISLGRQDMSGQMKAAGYDIHDTSQWLENFYRGLITAD